MKMSRKVLLLDLCGTLTNENTTFDFIDFIYKNDQSVKYISFLFFKKNIIIRTLNKLFFSIFKIDIIRVFGVLFLKGCTTEFLNRKAIEYVKYREHSINKKLITKIDEYVNDGYSVGIVSASLDFIVKAYCSYFKYDFFFSTELKYLDGISEGKITKDLLDNKREVISSIRISADNLVFISDNLGDLDAMLLCDDCIAISKSPKSDLFWNGQGVKVFK